MLKKFFRGILTIVGLVVGYGMYQLLVYLCGLNGYDLENSLGTAEKAFVVVTLVFIFGLIFYKLFPVFTCELIIKIFP